MRFLFSTVSIFLLFFSTALAENAKIKVGFTSNASFPHIIGDSDTVSSPPGISVEIVEHVMQQAGYEVEFIRVPGLRVLKMLEENKLDAAFLFSYSKEREKFGVYPDGASIGSSNAKLTTLSYTLFKLAQSELSWDGVQLYNQHRPIGANTGYSIVKLLRSRGVDVEEASTTNRNIKKLLARRIDALADQDIVVESYLKSQNIDNVVKLDVPIVTKDYYLIFGHQFAKENTVRTKKIWQLIEENRAQMVEVLLPKYAELLSNEPE